MRRYDQAKFLRACFALADCPSDTGFEVAFAGRSNSGKSSLINALTGHKTLSRISKTPGRTRALLFFALDAKRRFVDLPGYGYAKISKTEKNLWARHIQNYFENRKSLCGAVLTMDIRHPLQVFDEQMINWCLAHQMPLLIVLTKADKITRAAAEKTRQTVARKFENHPESNIQLFSTRQKNTIDKIYPAIDAFFHSSEKPKIHQKSRPAADNFQPRKMTKNPPENARRNFSKR